MGEDTHTHTHAHTRMHNTKNDTKQRHNATSKHDLSVVQEHPVEQLAALSAVDSDLFVGMKRKHVGEWGAERERERGETGRLENLANDFVHDVLVRIVFQLGKVSARLSHVGCALHLA